MICISQHGQVTPESIPSRSPIFTPLGQLRPSHSENYSLWRRIPLAHFPNLVRYFINTKTVFMRLFNVHLSPSLAPLLSYLSSRCRLPSHPCCSSFPSESSTYPFCRYLFSVIVLPTSPPATASPLRPSPPSPRASESNTHVRHCYRIVSSSSSL